MDNGSELLFDISERLNTEELEQMKFLCMPFIKQRKTCNIKNVHLFRIFEKEGLITADDFSFIYRLLAHISRSDLCTTIKGTKGIRVDSDLVFFKNSEFQFHEILYKMSIKMSPDDVDALRMRCHIPDYKTITYGFDVFSFMIQEEKLEPSKPRMLIELLTKIGRKDLADFFEEEMSSRPSIGDDHAPFHEDEMSSRPSSCDGQEDCQVYPVESSWQCDTSEMCANALHVVGNDQGKDGRNEETVSKVVKCQETTAESTELKVNTSHFRRFSD